MRYTIAEKEFNFESAIQLEAYKQTMPGSMKCIHRTKSIQFNSWKDVKKQMKSILEAMPGADKVLVAELTEGNTIGWLER